MPGHEVEMLPARVPDTRSKSLDTDDEQTRRDLHRAPNNLYPNSRLQITPALIPKRCLGDSAAIIPTTLSSQQSSIRPFQPSLLREQDMAHRLLLQVVAYHRIDFTAQDSYPSPFEPQKSQLLARSFPVAGTRASVVQKNMTRWKNAHLTTTTWH